MTTATQKSAFTLVELLAATAITLILVLSILGITTHVMASWNRVSGELSSNFEAKTAFTYLCQDLESMVIKNDGKVWLDVRHDSVNGIENHAHIMFFSTVLDRPLQIQKGLSFEKIQGDICAVQYLTQYKNPFGNAHIDAIALFGLYRTVVDAEHTLYLRSNAPTPMGLYNAHAAHRYLEHFWLGNSAFSQAVNEHGNIVSGIAFKQWATGSSNYLCSNSVNFRILFYYKDATNTVKPLVDSLGQPHDFIYLNGIQLSTGNSFTPLDSQVQLLYVDVSLTVLSDKGGLLLNSLEPSSKTSTGMERKRVTLEHGNTYSRRIYLLNTGF